MSKSAAIILLSPFMVLHYSCSSDKPSKSGFTLQHQLQNALDSIAVEYTSKGISAAVYTPDGETWLGVTGVSHGSTLIATDMIFCIASVTKPFTATCILQLAEEGVLALDDSLHEWLPSFPNIDSTITIRQLLNHTSGVYNFTENPAYRDSVMADMTRRWTPEETITALVLEPHWLPGTAYHYSNTDYILLGMIIKAATGSDVSTELRDRISKPLGLDYTFLSVEEVILGTIAHQWYDIDEDGTLDDISDLPSTSLLSLDWTAGAIYSTPIDLVNFSRALFEGDLLNQSTLNEMLDFYPIGDLGYGLGISIVEGLREVVEGVPMGVDGASPGWGARMVYLPENGVHIAITINNDNAFDSKVGLSVALIQVLNRHLR